MHTLWQPAAERPASRATTGSQHSQVHLACSQVAYYVAKTGLIGLVIDCCSRAAIRATSGDGAHVMTPNDADLFPLFSGTACFECGVFIVHLQTLHITSISAGARP